MSIENKVRLILSHVEQLNTLGKVEWQGTNLPDMYDLRLDTFLVTIEKVCPAYQLEGYWFRIFVQDKPVASLYAADKSDRSYHTLRDVWSYAFRTVEGVEETLDEILDYLEKR